MNIRSFEITPFAVNCYVVEDGGQAIVIDPGEAAPALLAAIKPLDVRMIVNTHGHCDHCGGNAGVKAATGAPLACHEADLPLIRMLEAQGQMFGVPFPPSPEPDRLLNEGDIITIGQVDLEVFHTPGHSAGHIVLIGAGHAFVGDVLFAGSIGRTDLPGGNFNQLLASIRTKLLSLPDATIVHSGHGPSTTIGDERESNPFLVDL